MTYFSTFSYTKSKSWKNGKKFEVLQISQWLPIISRAPPYIYKGGPGEIIENIHEKYFPKKIEKTKSKQII